MLKKLTTSVNFTSSCCLLPQIQYKKGHHERKAKYTSLADPPEMELARKVDQQRSDVSKNHFIKLALYIYRLVRQLHKASFYKQ